MSSNPLNFCFPLQIKLGMLTKKLFDRVRPAKCYAIGANLFKSKGVNKVSVHKFKFKNKYLKYK
ncbi:MAG: hypothetical protein EBU90_19555 [Proteobacteria bacterium]|nr:hypothetical protein [Pseudomonadota bacterium]NBP15717.1 hypothetical protein [bacterium]